METFLNGRCSAMLGEDQETNKGQHMKFKVRKTFDQGLHFQQN
jgi:hypothetical protein